MRLAAGLFLLSLLLTSGLAAQSLSGYQAQGRVRLTTPNGSISGTISVSFVAPNRCKAVLDFSSPARSRRIVAVFDGAQGMSQGPALLLNAVPLPVGPLLGCAFLAPHPAGPAASLTTVSGTTHAASLTWQQGQHTIALTYAYGSPGAAWPSSLTEAVDGATCLSVSFTSITPQSFTAADFAVPAVGGAQ